MPKAVSVLSFAHACDKIDPKQHDPQTINPVGHFETIPSADIAMDSKPLPNQESWWDDMA